MQATGNSVGSSSQTNQTINKPPTGDDDERTVQGQDFLMPMANIVRIMRRILPRHSKICNDAKQTMQECVSEFVSFITGEANNHCQQEKRKTVTAEDLLIAMGRLGFDDYIEPLTMYLQRYREHDSGEFSSIVHEQMFLSATDPVNQRRSMAILAPAFVVPQPDFYGPCPVDGFLMNPSGAGPSQVPDQS